MNESSDKESLYQLLVVDDDNIFLNQIENYGKQKLVAVSRAHTNAEALQIAKILPVDAALLDTEPGDDISIDLAQQIRQMAGYEELPLAFVSENPQIYNRIAATQAGACIYLTKPVSNLDLDIAFQQLFKVKQKKLPRVLVLDDDEALSSRIAAVLEREEMQVITLNDPVRILDVLDRTSPDIVITDIAMPGISGLDVCAMLHTLPRWQDLPVIFLSQLAGAEIRSQVFKYGGDDYLVKPCFDQELISRVKLRFNQSQLLKEKSHQDPLTGLLSRQAFADQLNNMLVLAQTQKLPTSICLFSINKFQSVNDQYGYQTGDNILSNLGQFLAKRFGNKDLRGRWGADEFIIAFYGQDKISATTLTKDFLKEFSQLEHFSENNYSFRVNTTTALAGFPEDGSNAYALITKAAKHLATLKEGKTTN